MSFLPNPKLDEELAANPEIREGLKASAEPGRVQAEAFARDAGGPWMPRAGQELVQILEDDTGIYLVNTDYGAHLMEWGSVNNAPHAPLRRGALAAGLRVVEDPKS